MERPPRDDNGIPRTDAIGHAAVIDPIAVLVS
jgi:hypothetical protein